MATEFLSEEDFINGILMRPVPFDVPDLGRVEVRGLSIVELNDLRNKHSDAPAMLILGVVERGLLTPKLSAKGVRALHDGNPGPIVAISNRVLQLSGQGGNKGGNGPLSDGLGSFPASETEQPA